MKYVRLVGGGILIAIAIWVTIDYLMSISNSQPVNSSWGIAKDSPIK